MSKAIHFEKSMAELEELVRQLERGDSTLEDCLKHYEKGMNLARKCQDALTQAEQKIETLRIKNLQSDGIPDE